MTDVPASPTLARFPEATSRFVDSSVTETAVEINVIDSPEPLDEKLHAEEVDESGKQAEQPDPEEPKKPSGRQPKSTKDDTVMTQTATPDAPKPQKKRGPKPGWKKAKAAELQAKANGSKPVDPVTGKKKPGPAPGWKKAKPTEQKGKAKPKGSKAATKSKPKTKPKATATKKPVVSKANGTADRAPSCLGKTITQLERDIAHYQELIDKRVEAIKTLTELSAE